MFEKEAKERARDFTDNKERQIAYECGFLDGADKMKKKNIELKEKLAGAERTRDNLIQIGFPTFQSCKEYAEHIAELKEDNMVMADNYSEMEQKFYNNLTKAKEIIKRLLINRPDTYSGTDVMTNQKKMFNFSNAINEAEQFLKEE